MDKLMNTEDAAEYLGVSPATMRAWRVRGKGPRFCKPIKGKGGMVRYYKQDLDAWARNGND